MNTITEPQFDAMVRDQKVVGYQLRVRVSCADCGAPFHFVGLPSVRGDMGHRPHARFRKKEAVLAMVAGVKTNENN